jgi:hypothetical protein
VKGYNELYKCAVNPITNPNPVNIHSKIMTPGVRSGIGLSRLIGFARTDSIKLRQEGCQVRRNESPSKRNEGHARKDGSQDRDQ